MKDPIERSGHGEGVVPTQTLAYEDVDTPVSATMLDTEEEIRSEGTVVRTPFRDAVRRFTRNWAAVASIIVIVLLILAAIFAPLLHTSDPAALHYNALNVGPSANHWFGTDAEGIDEYSRVLFGMRIPLIVSFVGTFLTVLLGLAFGLTAGFFGGKTDSILSRFTDLMFAFPALLLIIIIVSLFGPQFDKWFPNGVGRAIILTAVFALVSWPPLMRFIRSLALSMKEQQFIEAARTVGTSNFRIITRHLVPNVWGLTLVQGALTVAYIIGAEATLSVLGMGVNNPTPDLGAMLWDGAQNMDANFWGVFFPSLFLVILITSFTYIGDGIRDAVDPRMNQ